MNRDYIEKVENKHGKIIYWGIGCICKCCLQCYPEINPLFFVDTYSTYSSYENREVKHPEEICNWLDYYIIIAVKAEDAKIKIQQYLREKGLIKGQDFSTYDDFFSCSDTSIEMSINFAKKCMKEYPDMGKPTLLQIPLEGVRNYKDYINFMTTYIQKRGEKKCVALASLQVMSKELAEEKIKCPVVPIPKESTEEEIKRFELICDKFTEKELNWIKELGQRKKSEDMEKQFYHLVSLYYYFKTILEIIKPSKIIIWGNWRSESYILGFLAGLYNIPCGYMEHGWIPGTYQVDPRGIAGQSEYAVNPKMFEKMKIDDIYDIEQVKQYVRESKLDTVNFIDTKEDRNALLKIQPNKKNIFLVGLGEKGLHTNSRSNYWKKYVSNVVESTKEVLILLIELCKKNNWNLIFKPHPGEPVPELEQGLEDVIIVQNISIDCLISIADAVISIASAVDYKVLIYGKPLVQLGITGLLGKNCTYIVSKKEMLEEQIHLALKNGMTDEQTQNYNRLLQILLQKYLWDDMSDRSVRYGLSVERDFLE